MRLVRKRRRGQALAEFALVLPIILLFVAGVMNMWWVAAIAALVLLEKVAPRGLWVGRSVGLLLVGWGMWMLSIHGT